MKTEHPAAPSGQTFASVREVEASLKTRMEKALSDMQHDMAAIRTGRASLGILDHIRVDYYGTPTPLNQLANLHVPEPSLITIQPWDVSQIGPIEKVVQEVSRSRGIETPIEMLRSEMLCGASGNVSFVELRIVQRNAEGLQLGALMS